MKKKTMKRQFSRIIIVVLGVSMFLAVSFLMNYVRSLLNNDVEINLTEIVTQNKDTITSKLTLELNNISLIATQITDHLDDDSVKNNQSIKEIFLNYGLDESDVGTVFVADQEGKAYFKNREIIDIAGRSYYKLSMEGKQNVSDRVISRLDGTEVFIMSVPMVKDEKIIGCVQKMFSPQEMYDLCSISMFSSQGYMNIVNSEGYVLISSQFTDYNQEHTNFYRLLYSEGNKTESEKLKQNIENETEGFMETIEDGKKIFSAYTPIEGIHDWFIITSVSNDAVSPNGNIIFKMFYIILMGIVLFFTIMLLYIFYTKRKQQLKLEQIAFVDTVTQGHSFTKFLVNTEEVLHLYPEKDFYLLKFDIDNFKYINNYYGYDYGDKILRRIYETIHAQLTSNESIARMSNDHFVALLEDIQNDRVNLLMTSIDCDDDLLLYLSAGMYTIHNHDESISMMVDKAGSAARNVKNSLIKKVEMYSEKYDQQMIEREQMKRNIRKAMEEDEFIAFYQPKVNIYTNELIGSEALARWKSNGRLIPPNDFIPLCETCGLIIDLDLHIFESVLKFLRKMLNEGVACVPVSINLSRLHLFDKKTLQVIADKMKLYQIPTSLIEIELTESAFFDNMDIIIEFISELHKQGFQVSMDDFGSGYSSLNMLKDVAIDVLKIDRGFLLDTSNIEKRQVIFSTIAEMSKKLNIKVIVEGVETIENIQMMKDARFEFAQGYYYSRPVEEEQYERICKEGKICLKE